MFFPRIAHKKNWNVAVVATARKLMVIAFHMLKNNEPYRYAQPWSPQKLRRLRLKGGRRGAPEGSSERCAPQGQIPGQPEQGGEGPG